jgi:hypothetical protein
MQTPNASPQGIASLYMGNPGALKQKVDKEQQTNPGMPPDLKNLMALNIVTNEQDAAKRQEAMNALNQMAPGGQPPTVAQSIQEQAKQKLQAQMLQQQQQQQGLQALAQARPGQSVPDNTPQPAEQPQGIDQLPAELQLAGGGIVAFKKGDEVSKDEQLKEQAESDRRALRSLWDAVKDAGGNVGRAIADIGTLGPRGLAGAFDTAVIRPARALGADVGYLSGHLVPEGVDPSSMTPFTDSKRLREKQMQEAAGQVADVGNAPPKPQPSQAELEAAYRNAVATGNAASSTTPPPNRKPPATAPAKPPAAAPAATSVAAPNTSAAAPAGLGAAYENYLEKNIKADPEVARAKAVADYEKAIGKPDTAQYDNLIKELEGRKAQFNKPAEGFDAFAELMQNIANQGPQRSWYESGAKGSAAQIAMNKERQAQQFDLTKQAIDVAQKKIDAERAYRKDLYATGADAAKRVEEISKETAKEFGLDKRNREVMENHITTANIGAEATKEAARIHGKYNVQAAGVRAEAANGEDKQRLNELKALQTSIKDQLKDPGMIGAKGAQLRAQLAEVNAAIAKMAGVGTMAGAPGAASPGGSAPGWGKASVVK